MSINLPTAGKEAFKGLYSKPLSAPEQSVSLYKEADEWKKFYEVNTSTVDATKINIYPTQLALLVGQESTLTAALTPKDATTKILWSVEEGAYSVVSVSQLGKITGIAPGTATVLATAGNVSATCKVTVKDSADITVIPGEGTGGEQNEDNDNGFIDGTNVTVHVNRSVILNLKMPEGLTDLPELTWKLAEGGEEIVFLIPFNDTLSAIFTGKKVGNSNYSVSLNGKDIITGKVTVIADKEPDKPSVSPADTPTQLLRKGDGTSHTFVTMMQQGDELLEATGYNYVFGYDSTSLGAAVIADTPWRYSHTTAEIYESSSYDFWVFAYYVDDEGTMHVSSRRHLNGKVDDDFDPAGLLSASKGRSDDTIIGIYTVEGKYLGTDLNRLNTGVYIIKTNNISYKIIK